MPAQTVSKEVEKQNGPGAMIEQYRGDFAAVLPSHIKPATWVRLAQGVLRRDKNLLRVAQQNPASLMQALLEAARLGHEPGTDAFYLVPFGNEVTGIEGYRGIVERVYRAGAVSSVIAEVVREGDEFIWKPGSVDTDRISAGEPPRWDGPQRQPYHEVDWFGERGAIRGAYAYCVMRDGSISRVVVINQQYIERVRKESKGSNSASSPWNKWEDAMVLKTVARRLEAWVPTSSEYMREQLRAIRDVQAEAPQPLIPQPAVVQSTGEVIDADVYEPTPAEIAAWNDEADADPQNAD